METILSPSPLRVVFMGTPDFAARVLKAVAGWPGGETVAVYTQPDRPAGRGNKTHASAVKMLALDRGIPVLQPPNFKTAEAVAELRALAPDVLVVAAYGLILPQCVLDIPRLGAYNVHASLLPQYRGAAPVQRALMRGDALTGVTIMRMEAGLDTGPMVSQQAIPISPEDNAGTLLEALAEQGGKLMTGALGMIAEGRAAVVPQNDALATHAAKISPEDERVDWSRSARAVHNHIRGLSPAPGARTVLTLPGKEPLPLKIDAGEPLADMSATGSEPGTLLSFDAQGLVIACGEGAYRVTRLRPSGKPSMNAADFANGRLRGLTPPFGRFSA